VINTGLSLEVIKKSGSTIMFGEQNWEWEWSRQNSFCARIPKFWKNKIRIEGEIDATFDDSKE